DHVDGDALGPEVARPTAGVGGHGGFRSGVVGYPGPRRRRRGAGAYRDDAATFGHDLRGFAHGGRDAAHVDRELPVHLRGIDLTDCAGDEDAGVVHENIEMAEVIDDLAHQLRHFTRIGLVRLERDGTHALSLELTHQRFRLVG